MYPTVPSDTHEDEDEPLRSLPRGPHSLAREVVLASQRGRMLEAMAEVVAAKGYGATTVADVIARAKVSRKTFYEQFRDKEACFLAAYDAGVELLVGALREVPVTGDDLLGSARARTRIYLETLAAEPAFARTFLIEVAAAGPAARERREAVHDRFAALLREQLDAAREAFPQIPVPPDEVYLAAVGATDLVVSRLVARGRTSELPQLEDAVLHIQLSLLAGGAAAVAAAARR
ncbi:MAG: TetR/AcrR family transcriptional regulator [Solirubrobacterales bacterium]|nr:TetR/AcrR family transcriptional regulator [Solirubrobacterales bacterium]